MLYCFWKQEYDSAGVALAEGPPDADINALKKEFLDGWNDHWDKYINARYSVPYDEYSFGDSFLEGFVDWLCDIKGFKKVEHKFERWA